MSSKKLIPSIALFSLFLNMVSPKIGEAKNIQKPLVENKNNFSRFVDTKGGFLVEENSIRVLKNKKEGLQKKKKEEPKKQKEMYVEATAYSSTVFECDSSPFITASGTKVHFGTLAANFLPFGTKVKIPDYFGDKIFVVEDRMAYSNRIDIWMPSYKEAIQFGRKRVKIIIVE